MGKESSKNFRDRIRKSAEVHLEGKNGTRSTRKRSESEILAMYYSEQDIERGEKRIEKRIAKKRIQDERNGVLQKEVTQERDYYYVRKVPEGGMINSYGISEEQYYNPNSKGYKAKIMISAYDSPNGPRQIQVEHRGDYTDEEKKILNQNKMQSKIAEDNLKSMQDMFKDEDFER